MIGFPARRPAGGIDDHRGACGVKPICRVLPIAPSTGHEHVARHADPSRLPARAQRGAGLQVEIRRVFEENLRVEPRGSPDIDAFARRIVGWRVSRSAHAGFVLDAIGQALHERRPVGGTLIHHPDGGGHMF